MESATKVDIGAIARSAAEYQIELDAVKSAIEPRAFDWYPYDSLGSLFTLDELLTGESRCLLGLLGSGPVLDLGCADGALSFFLESIGCRMHAIDQPRTNYNGMQGVFALKRALNSAIEIHQADVDTYFTLPERRYTAAFMFGILYHLKNPFYVLETLSRHARYCFLSTRITRFTPDGRTNLHGVPVAYLVDSSEANNDPTNYWIFSEAGLRRLLDRANWVVRDFRTVGNTESSDPVSWQGDERAFCFAERRPFDKVTEARLVSGWHDLEEEGSWRWTERTFSALFAKFTNKPRLSINLHLLIPEGHLRARGPLALTARVNGAELSQAVYASDGAHIYTAFIPQEALATALLVEFELSHALPPSEQDPRELGVVISRLEVS